MLKLSVHQFVSHLPVEQQGPVLVSQEAFLSFLRSEFRRNDYTKRALAEAAVAYAKKEYVTVSCLADERYAAKAVIYAYMQLGDELLRRGKVVRPKSHFRVYRPEQEAQLKREPELRFKSVEVSVNGYKERITQYPLDISWEEARAFQQNDLYELPEVGLEEEWHVTGATAHFEASSRPTGWGWLTIEGEAVERVRCWENE